MLILRSLSSAEDFRTYPQLYRLWVHEVYRVYYDRLVENKDRQWFYESINKIVEEQLITSTRELFSDYISNREVECRDEHVSGVIFGDFIGNGPNKRYQGKTFLVIIEIVEFSQATEFLKLELEKYNSVNKAKMNLVLFRFAVEHIAKICRILSFPEGHALLLGVGGSGRQSITKLAAFVKQYDVFQIEPSKNYGKTEWVILMSEYLILER
jgi:dynein heavy chain